MTDESEDRDRRHEGDAHDQAWEPPYSPLVVFQISDSAQIDLESFDLAQFLQSYEYPGDLDDLVQSADSGRLFSGTSDARLEELRRRALDANPDSDPAPFTRFGAIYLEEGSSVVAAEQLAELLASLEDFDWAYVASKPTRPPAIVDSTSDFLSSLQGYLGPSGIDVISLWEAGGIGLAGSNGSGVRVVDIEYGWDLKHPDLPPNIPLLDGLNVYWVDHGTSVLGVLVAINNTADTVGIAPAAEAAVVSTWKTKFQQAKAHALMKAIEFLVFDDPARPSFGDVILLELQTDDWYPVEVEQAMYEVISLASALGIVVVEAAGNADTNLDQLQAKVDGVDRFVFDPNSPDYRDSGAIMVGATVPPALDRKQPCQTWVAPCSNYGSRIDCFAWGSAVTTLMSGSNTTTNFNGTSAASAIIAGAAVVVEGVAGQSSIGRITPHLLRELFRTTAFGTPSDDPPSDRVGPMPKLSKIFQSAALALLADPYMRDFVGDNGDPHVGSASASPDIIVRNALVPLPTDAFGENSGTKNQVDLSDPVDRTRDNFLYVRLLNRGQQSATGVTTTVYWSRVSTLLLPELWTEIGSVTLPTLVGNNFLTVAGPIVWPKAEIPVSGHYCFVAVTGTAADPAPQATEFLNWDFYRAYVRNNNNVAWRNFNVVDTGPAAAPWNIQLPFIMPIPRYELVLTRLEFEMDLEPGVECLLDMPAYMPVAMGAERDANSIDPTTPRVRMHLPESKNVSLGDMMLAPGRTLSLELIVRGSGDPDRTDGRIRVSQVINDEEVGAVTWLLKVNDPQER